MEMAMERRKLRVSTFTSNSMPARVRAIVNASTLLEAQQRAHMHLADATRKGIVIHCQKAQSTPLTNEKHEQHQCNVRKQLETWQALRWKDCFHPGIRATECGGPQQNASDDFSDNGWLHTLVTREWSNTTFVHG